MPHIALLRPVLSVYLGEKPADETAYRRTYGRVVGVHTTVAIVTVGHRNVA